jgi:hypothetical protein
MFLTIVKGARLFSFVQANHGHSSPAELIRAASAISRMLHRLALCIKGYNLPKLKIIAVNGQIPDIQTGWSSTERCYINYTILSFMALETASVSDATCNFS